MRVPPSGSSVGIEDLPRELWWILVRTVLYVMELVFQIAHCTVSSLYCVISASYSSEGSTNDFSMSIDSSEALISSQAKPTDFEA